MKKSRLIFENKSYDTNSILYAMWEINRAQLKIGDYVDYKPSISSNYTLSSSVSAYTSNQSISQESFTWRILDIYSDGKVVLISTVPTKTIVYLRGAKGYNNGVYVLNDICAKLYSNNELGITARSINITDIEERMSEEGLSARNNDNIGKIVVKQNVSYPALYAQENGSGIGGTAAKKDGIGTSESYYTTPTTNTYFNASKLTTTQTLYGWSNTPTNYMKNNTIHSLIFQTGKDFWTTSRYVSCDNGSNTEVGYGIMYVGASGGIGGHYLHHKFHSFLASLKGTHRYESLELEAFSLYNISQWNIYYKAR